VQSYASVLVLQNNLWYMSNRVEGCVIVDEPTAISKACEFIQ